jgi:hypothetical protein
LVSRRMSLRSVSVRFSNYLFSMDIPGLGVTRLAII